MTMAFRAALRRGDRWVRAQGRRSPMTWRWGLNAAPTLAYRRARPAIDGHTAELIDALDRDGIAITSLDRLVGPDATATFLASADRARNRSARTVTDAREALGKGGDDTQKPFVVGLLDGSPSTDQGDELTGFALDPAVLSVVHGYYGMFVWLRYVDLWHTLVTDAPPSQSQLWHRDPEDRLILKVFVALEDVDDGAGPFHYAPGTHAKGAVRARPAVTTIDGTTPRSTDEQMDAVVPTERRRTAIGPRGTVVFADTRGFHKGGHAVARERILYVCQYLSRAAGRGGVPTGRPALDPRLIDP